ncbi:hypothetical protein ACFYE9_35940 [Rhizobium leguminosarum]|uniref:hypothetical protein n=1 Tax=Rhizobium leguminosarum TaxID=384 RepID=UPI0036D76674
MRNTLERQENRQYAEWQIDHRHRNHHSGLVEDEELARLLQNTRGHQDRIEKTIETQDAADRIDLDDVIHDERKSAEQQQEIPEGAFQAPDQVRDDVAKNQRDDRHDEGKLQCPEEHVEIAAAREEGGIVLQGEASRDLAVILLQETVGQERQERDHNHDRRQAVDQQAGDDTPHRRARVAFPAGSDCWCCHRRDSHQVNPLEGS